MRALLRRFWRYIESDGGSVPYGVMGVTLAVFGTVFAVLADGAVSVRAGMRWSCCGCWGVVAVWQQVRPRLLLTSGIGWVIAMAISTTATPTGRGVPLGLAVGAGLALMWSLLTRSGVRLEFDPDKVYDRDDGPKPRMETVVLVGTGVLAVVGVGLLGWG